MSTEPSNAETLRGALPHAKAPDSKPPTGTPGDRSRHAETADSEAPGAETPDREPPRANAVGNESAHTETPDREPSPADPAKPSYSSGTIEAGGGRMATHPTPGSPEAQLSHPQGTIEAGGGRDATHPTSGSGQLQKRRTPEAPLASGGPDSRHTRPRDRQPIRRSTRRRVELIAIGALLALPLGLALVGPFLPVPAADRTQPFDPAAPWPGTDYLGVSVLTGLFDGGWGIVLTAAAATLIAFLVGLPIGLAAAATRHRWLDEILMRPFDLLLALPSLLLMLLLASIAPPTAWMLVLIVALVNLPDIARIVRAAALEVAHRPAVEAMWLQGEGWWRINIGYVAKSILPTVAADAGVRLVGAFYLVAAASFLGVGAGPEASDWAVMVDVNRGGIFLSPWGVVLPAALLVALSVGLNLLFDRLLAREERP